MSENGGEMPAVGMGVARETGGSEAGVESRGGSLTHEAPMRLDAPAVEAAHVEDTERLVMRARREVALSRGWDLAVWFETYGEA